MDKKPRKARSRSREVPEPDLNVKQFTSPTPPRPAVGYPKASVIYASSKAVSGNSVERAHKQPSPRRRRS